MFFDVQPALVVVGLQAGRIQRGTRGPDHMARLEHEGHGRIDLVRLRRVRLAGLLEGRRVGPMPAHAVVQTGAARPEAVGLRIVDPVDCLLYTSPSPRDVEESRMPSSA